MSEQVLVQQLGEVTLVTIRRGKRGNALDAATWDALRRASIRLSDAPPRALVLTGDPCFSTGLDLSDDNPIVARLEALAKVRDTYKIAEYVGNLRSAIVSFGRIPCPVVAAIEGSCLGAGLELALTSDLRIAGRTAMFGLPEVRRGFAPMCGGLVHLRRIVGETRAAELALTGRELDADTALGWGLLNEVTEPGQALGAALQLANDLLQHSRQAVLQSTLALRQLAANSDAYDIETQAAARAVNSGDLSEGRLAFLQKRAPKWAR